MASPKKRKQPSQPSNQAAGIATKMFSIILAGALLGLLLDRVWQTEKPYFTAFFTVAAVFYSLYSVLREFL